jgi:hypothetical protein
MKQKTFADTKVDEQIFISDGDKYYSTVIIGLCSESKYNSYVDVTYTGQNPLDPKVTIKVLKTNTKSQDRNTTVFLDESEFKKFIKPKVDKSIEDLELIIKRSQNKIEELKEEFYEQM